MNKFWIAGYLVKPPVIEKIPTGTIVCNAVLAVKATRRDHTSFLDIRLWGKTAEAFCKWFDKGHPVYATGEIVQERWENRDGQKRNRIVFNVENWHFPLRSSKPPVEQEEGDEHRGYEENPPITFDDDEVPF